ncbi:MAG TPA: sulfatase-like hydrolase/transferase [Candidatus Hydrogenedentes bacterium]|nr:sulfatase-like hydrolase/transferase [Candidatus Hydrogenedentota bacterium]
MKRLTRRDFVAASAAMAATSCVSHGKEAAKALDRGTMAEKPNILIIHTDQHRMECLGAYGNREIRTPNIDSLAADGVRFDNSFCPYPVCTPSRYSFISGVYVHEHRGWNNHCTLPPGTDTFPRLLKQAGYRTKAVGKMHYAPTYLDVGFSEMILAEQDGPGRWDDDYHRMLQSQGLIDFNDLEDQVKEYREKARPEYWENFGALKTNLPLKYHSTEWIGARAQEALQQWNSSGELLMAGFIKPHHPFDPPEEYGRRYDPATLTLLPGWTDTCFEHDLAQSRGYFDHTSLTESALKKIMAYYYANITHIDDQVGKMVRILKDKGLYGQTMIIFTSDHGEYLGYHHMLLKGNFLYDPLAKVPLIIKFPHSLHKGTTSQALVNTTDAAPTILAQTGCPIPQCMRGLNLANPQNERNILFAESDGGKQVMARTRTRKLILHRTKNVGLFYDLEKDPCEHDNRYQDPAYQSEIKTMTESLDQWRPSDNLPKVYLDEEAPVIGQPNVPDRHDDHRMKMIAYTKAKMKT